MGLLRSPFARKLLGALLGTVLLLATGVGWAVRRETGRQVEAVSLATIEKAEADLRAVEELKRGQLRGLLDRLSGLRTAAAIDAVVEGADPGELVGLADYELQLNGVENQLVVFHDPDGYSLISRTGTLAISGEDPFELLPLVDSAYASEDGTASGYRLSGGDLYRVETRLAILPPLVVGAITVGSPVDRADLEAGAVTVASPVDQDGRRPSVELCFLSGSECVIGTDAASRILARLLPERGDEAAGMLGMVTDDDGSRWEVFVSEFAGSGDLHVGWAVPLDPVLEPFERINSALLIGGLASLLLAALVSGLLARGLTGPVVRLTRATRRVAGGDYDVEVPVESKDEIGTLAGAFNEMTEGLRLKERYRGVLNKVVSPEVATELMAGEVVLGGETRQATVLFGDLRGFTATTSTMEPQSVIRLLNECMEELSDAVDRAGGVVDKFVGDEIMAIFGAPVSREDDAARAVRAAIDMQEALIRLNDSRAQRGEPVLGLGIGINTGEVVAGNMGSPNRLNYTVVGSTVNLAARLCSSADPGEILIGESTRTAMAQPSGIQAESVGRRPFKGFTDPIEVFRVQALRMLVCLLGAGAGHALAPVVSSVPGVDGGAALTAQEWPTIRDRAYLSNESGSVQFGLSGRLELDAYLPADSFPGLIGEQSAFFHPRLRLLADAFLGDYVQMLVELRGDRGDVPGRGDYDARIEQAFLRLGPGPLDGALTVGRFPSPVGGYAARHLTLDDPFIRPPVPYDQRTVVSDRRFPVNIDEFIGWRARPETFRRGGLPPIWQVPYPWGAMIEITPGPVTLHAAYVNSAPSSVSAAWDFSTKSLKHPTWIFGARLQASPELSLSAWRSHGPYIFLRDDIPNYKELFDYAQTLTAVQAEWRRGATLARAEVWLDQWELPFVMRTVSDLPWSVALQQDLRPGFYLAGRLGGIFFRPTENSSGESVAWDDDVVRAELAAGYRLAVNAGRKMSVGNAWTPGGIDPADGLFALQLWWEF